jgi:hypothetical protein
LPVVKVRDFSVCMKKIFTISCFSLSFLTLFAILGSQTSCQKQTTNCTAVVIIDSTGGNDVSHAFVKLYAPHGQVEASGYTNSAGKITFTFGLPAIFNVASTYCAAGATDTIHGTGIIELQIGQTVTTTVTVK